MWVDREGGGGGESEKRVREEESEIWWLLRGVIGTRPVCLSPVSENRATQPRWNEGMREGQGRWGGGAALRVSRAQGTATAA